MTFNKETFVKYIAWIADIKILISIQGDYKM